MNLLNYASLEASQRLIDAGIEMETEKVWALNAWITDAANGKFITREEWRLINRPMIGYKQQIPAPSMADVWMGLPETLKDKDGCAHALTLQRFANGDNLAYYHTIDGWPVFAEINPTDALIDLLIWVTGQKGKE